MASEESTPAPDPDAPRRPFGGRIGVALVMALCGVLFVTTARLAGGDSLRDDSGDVASVLRERDVEISRLGDEARTKREAIDGLTAQGADAETEARTQVLTDEVGLSEVSGPALRITLTDAPTGVLGSMHGVEPDDLVVHQQDMESFINALWAGGAESMMLMDQRVVGGSAFRCAGNTLLLEGRVYSPPFVITVIGPTDRMLAALDADPGVSVYREWVDYVGLGEKIETLDTTTLPAYDGSLSLDAATTTP
ncbi:DUF881 domain-containing protein [Brachybacterium squillarum]|uniref:DUF881 domain-containing protein n=1 Tax=Brachybacterium squillarum TaxID=661979 RepID=UPI002221EA6A|nr:DUF881 domain-containing protein [Brachybacterium squillarum]MCW1805589.1 DUF881 domain-containing protein [Brachybacterium squillarum]